MFSGYTGRILWVDLTRGKQAVTNFKEGFARKYIGGNGFGIKMLLQECPSNIDPLAPANPFIIAVGPLARTIVPTSDKYGVFAKSPLTGFLGEGYASGSFGGEIRSAGYDIIVIQGRQEKLSYLWIDDDNIQIRDATNLPISRD
ncbi:MAG: aldehyde ferredoxin oxidoreductase N-terminal domain-containing protein [Candidatus Hodarchaeales archaeon]